MRWSLIFLFVLAAPGAAQQVPPTGDHGRLQAVIEAEDARAPTTASLAVLTRAVADASPWLRAYAARALGRLERPELVDVLVPALRDADARVRARAAWAIAQALHGAGPTDPQVGRARDALRSALADETDATAGGAMLEAVGRLPIADNAQAVEVGMLIAESARGVPEAGLGAARGLYFLGRQRGARQALPTAAVALLNELALAPPAGEAGRRIRVAAAQALVAAGTADVATVDALLKDPDASVRREAVAAAPTLAESAPVRRRLDAAWLDEDPSVRYAALVALRRIAPSDLCTVAGPALTDPDSHVALTGIQTLGRCPAAALRLDSIAGTLTERGEAWHRPAAALVSLAAVNAARAAARLPAFGRHPDPFVRAHAAAAAGAIGDAAALRSLAADSHPIVRTAAVSALADVEGRAADPVYIAQLARDDGQLLMTAAMALEGTTNAAALPALLDALDRISAQRRETSRDPRMALLERIEALGSAAHAPRVEPRLRDFDPVIAERAADIIGRWTGTRPAPMPEPPPTLELPTVAQLLELGHGRVTIVMEDAGTIELRLLPFEAPTNAWRFVRLAREGWYDGLTFHRVVPNFVIQGGSPAANEYAGDGPFTRDEIGRPHWRGTVGLSTRGRDTGDAQIFVNLVDNLRLDSDYTVFAEVVDGMDVADRLLEGARIRRVIVRAP